MDFIFFSDDRSGVPTSSMHLADQLAKRGRVFWINTYTRMPTFSVKDAAKALRVLSGLSVKPKMQESSIVYSTPKSIPYFVQPFRTVNGMLGKRFLLSLFRKWKIESPILIATFPCSVDTFQAVRSETTQIYYCVDDWTEFLDLYPLRQQKMERQLLDCVDGAAFTSRHLLEKKTHKKNNLYLPHGVDFEHFARTNSNGAAFIPQLEKLPRPIVGFFGTMDVWVDLAAIAALAKRFPLVSFVVLGRSLISLDVFNDLPNVHCLGSIPYAELPEYASYFDVGLIPFVMNDLTKAVNPLKLMEYFAIGVPVISSRLPDISDVKGPIYFADTHKEFGDQLELILSQNKDELRKIAQATALENSWASRADSLISFVSTVR